MSATSLAAGPLPGTEATIATPRSVQAIPGPLLLNGIDDAPDLAVHRNRWGPLPRLSGAELVSLAAQIDLTGRGGAGFPFHRKLANVVAARRPVVVVNAAEGEPASAKDTVLTTRAPHLVLDGALLVARAVGAKTIHVVGSAGRPSALAALDAAVRERRTDKIRWQLVAAPERFVSGQARAVLELLAGRPALPVTAWEPESIRGLASRPTLLSNAETFAHLAAAALVGADRYAAAGSPGRPGTVLLTVAEERVIEVPRGASFAEVLRPHELAGPVLMGGFHGTWTEAASLTSRHVDAVELRSAGIALGAGIVLLVSGRCPVGYTASITAYLAEESAGRCGPCRNGLPTLARELSWLAEGADTTRRITELAGLVAGRGACAHPDGTARLVATLLALPGAVADHLAGRCDCRFSEGVR